jgi:hypothetical protein
MQRLQEYAKKNKEKETAGVVEAPLQCASILVVFAY